MLTIVVDIYEADEFADALTSHQVNVVRNNMVSKGYADIYWMGSGAVTYTFEHKTAVQLCSEMGLRLDGQLRKHSQNADVVGLIVDGPMTPREGGGVDFWKLSTPKKESTQPVFHKYRHTPIGYEVMEAYLWSLNRDGIYTFKFDTLDAMALGVAAFAANSLKTQHNTLTHHVRSRPVVFKENPHIMTLMGLHTTRNGKTRPAGIGEKTAIKILEHWGTPWNFYRADYDEGVEILGRETFLHAMRAIGRTTL